jgi:HK97 family phage major capsid protein
MPSSYNQATKGRELTREQVVDLLVQPLEAAAVVLAAGAHVFDAFGGVPVRVPRISSVALTDAWRLENTLIAEVDPTYDELVLLPSSLPSLKIIHRISNELARNSAVDVVNALKSALVAKIAAELDRAFLSGDGAAGGITGLINQDGVQEITSVGAPSVDDLFDAENMLLTANADPTTAAWFMSPRSLTALRKLRDGSGGAGTGPYLLQPDVSAAGRFTLLGHPLYVTSGIPNDDGAGDNESSIVLADMSRVAVGRDDDFSVALLDQTFGNWDQIAIRITARFDIGMLNSEAAVVLRGVTG